MDWKTFDFKTGKTRMDRKSGRILEGNSFRCSLCGGKGVLPGTNGTECPVCKGVGMFAWEGPALVCAYCKGKGVYPSGTNLTCTVCAGKGLVSIATKSIEACCHCQGTGAEPTNKLPCLKCKGKGFVPQYCSG